jgi:pilus assembly protein CpaD
MTAILTKTSSPVRPALRLALAVAVCVSVAGCKTTDDDKQVTGWTLTDPSQRHPIMVSQQPAKMSVRIARGSHGLTAHQRAQVVEFTSKYRAGDSGNSRMIISAPSGSANEVAAMQAVAELRHLLRDSGFDEASINVEAYHEDRDPQPPIRISYTRYVAEAPDCGHFPANLTSGSNNMPHANLGCANQKNFANQIANPADLVSPRAMTASSGERRDMVHGKYIKGDPTGSAKQADTATIR